MPHTQTISKNEEYLRQLVDVGAKTPCDVDFDFEVELPQWADHDIIKRAQLFFFLNLNACVRGIGLGLLQIIPEDTIYRILEFTKQSSTPRLAYKRYKSTFLHGQLWGKNDLKPGTLAWDSINYIRRVHLTVNKRAQKSGVGIVSQKDMALTQFAFVGMQLLNPEKLGIKASRFELECFSHNWRVMGYLLGIEDRFNVCGISLDDTLGRLRAIKEDLLMPNFVNLDPKIEEFARIAVEGMKGFQPLLNADVQLFTIKRMLGVPGHHYFAREAIEGSTSNEYKSLSLYSRLQVTMDVIIYEYLSLTWGCRWLFNIPRMLFSVFEYFPIFAIIKFGRKYAYVEVLKAKPANQ